MRRSILWVVALSGVALATACSEGFTGVVLAPCTTARGLPLTLAIGEYVAVATGSYFGCTRFGANASATDSVTYLLVPQLATSAPDVSSSFALRGDTLRPPAASVVPGAANRAFPQRLSPAEQFHRFLRQAEETRWATFPPSGQAAGLPVGPARAAAPPNVGDVRQFSVCANLTCAIFKKITATAKTVGAHLAIYVDDAAPANGLIQADLDSLSTLLDTQLYRVDSAAFGGESDIDGNKVVLVLLTPVVNALVSRSECDTAGYVAGFFLGGDIDPIFAADQRVNHGEVFYTIVPDPDSTLSCAHSRSQVKAIVPITFVHEIQHMISYNQHVLLRRGAPEVLWLNEGMSHFAEELGGRSFLPGDSAAFSRFVSGNLFNAFKYLSSPGDYHLLSTAGIGGLAERGAAWLFVRYLADRYGVSVAGRLTQTSLTGAANVAQQTGVPFAMLVERWALANWVSDLPGFTAPAELRYTSWAFRTTFASLNAQRPTIFDRPFPLVPTTSGGNLVNLTGTLRAGSGVFHVATQAAGAAGFSLLFSTSAGARFPDSLVARLNVIRVR